MVDYEPKNWVGLLFNLRGSVVRGIAGRIVLTAGMGGIAVLIHQRTGFKIPPIAHTLIGAALALLLVFRTNASYDRYWEGRRLFGAMANRMRDLARQLSSLVEIDAAERAGFHRHLMAFYRLAVQSLRRERDLAPLAAELDEGERAALLDVGLRHYVVLAWISGRLDALQKRGDLDAQRLMLCDVNVTALTDAIGGCERIRNTPVPIAYAHHIKMFVTLFCFSVPFAMVGDMQLYTPLAVAVLAFALFGIDEIGVEIEEPFGYDPNDLALDQMAKAIDTSLGDILRVGPHRV
jgi:ion channel-forming bestrophin family protein